MKGQCQYTINSDCTDRNSWSCCRYEAGHQGNHEIHSGHYGADVDQKRWHLNQVVVDRDRLEELEELAAAGKLPIPETRPAFPDSFDTYQYKAGEYAYDSYKRYVTEFSPSSGVTMPHFRELSKFNQDAWAYMASEFKRRFQCQA